LPGDYTQLVYNASLIVLFITGWKVYSLKKGLLNEFVQAVSACHKAFAGIQQRLFEIVIGFTFTDDS